MMSRRAFLERAGRILVWTATAPIAGCLYALNPEEPLPPVLGDEAGSISDNHLHEAVITKDQLEAGLALTLDITGRSTHPHIVVLSAADMLSIRLGKTVTVLSSNDWGHDHLVEFNPV